MKSLVPQPDPLLQWHLLPLNLVQSINDAHIMNLKPIAKDENMYNGLGKTVIQASGWNPCTSQ